MLKIISKLASAIVDNGITIATVAAAAYGTVFAIALMS